MLVARALASGIQDRARYGETRFWRERHELSALLERRRSLDRLHVATGAFLLRPAIALRDLPNLAARKARDRPHSHRKGWDVRAHSCGAGQSPSARAHVSWACVLGILRQVEDEYLPCDRTVVGALHDTNRNGL